MNILPFSEKQMLAMSWWCSGSKYEDYNALICDGAIRSGKTVCMAVSFVLWAFYRFNSSAFGVCGKTIRSLKRNVITPIIPLLNSIGFYCQQNLSQNFVEITHGGHTNIFYLFGGKDESSAALIQGITLSGILFDEVALMPKTFVEQALARCSVEDSKFWFNCNPEYPHHWFYKEWILKQKEHKALYLHFTMKDNPALSQKLIERYRNLYSGSFYERFVEGKWVSVEGLIYPFMNNKKFYFDVPKEEEFMSFAVSCDYGIVNPTSCGLWGELKGVWYRIDEYYFDSKARGETRTDEEHYGALCKLIGERKIKCITVDPSAASFITLLRKKTKWRVIPAKNNVLDGIREVSTALKNGSIKICSSCVNSIREFSLYRWNEGGVKDMPVKENDHAMDDIRYFVSSILKNEEHEEFFAISAKR